MLTNEQNRLISEYTGLYMEVTCHECGGSGSERYQDGTEEGGVGPCSYGCEFGMVRHYLDFSEPENFGQLVMHLWERASNRGWEEMALYAWYNHTGRTKHAPAALGRAVIEAWEEEHGNNPEAD